MMLEARAFEVDLRHQLAAAATWLEPGEIPKHSYGWRDPTRPVPYRIKTPEHFHLRPQQESGVDLFR
jgi:hypothetical protein